MNFELTQRAHCDLVEVVVPRWCGQLFHGNQTRPARGMAVLRGVFHPFSAAFRIWRAISTAW